jgi:hypothetical protein
VLGTQGPDRQPDRLSPRQPKGEKGWKRGSTIDQPGFDAGKQIKGKKRHLLVDTLGLVVHASVHPADLQDRDGGILLLASLAARFPLLAKLFADGASQGPLFPKALAKVRPQLKTEIVRKDQAPATFRQDTIVLRFSRYDVSRWRRYPIPMPFAYAACLCGVRLRSKYSTIGVAM